MTGSTVAGRTVDDSSDTVADSLATAAVAAAGAGTCFSVATAAAGSDSEADASVGVFGWVVLSSVAEREVFLFFVVGSVCAVGSVDFVGSAAPVDSVGAAACDVPVLVWALTTPDPTGSVADFGGVLMASGSEVFAVLVGSVADAVGSMGFDGASFLAGVPPLAEVSEVSEAADVLDVVSVPSAEAMP